MLRTEFRKIEGKPAICFEYGWRTFKAMRSLLFSALFFVESQRVKKSKYSDAIVCYPLYYSLFHASFSLLCIHPQIEIEKIRKIKHNQLMNYISVKFVQTKILPQSYAELVEKTKIMRELTTYFTPLSGLNYSTVARELSIKSAIKEVKQNLKYSFQLANVINSVYWNMRNKKSEECIDNCRTNFITQEQEIGNRVKELINYQPFSLTKHWSVLGDDNYDREDEGEAYRHFGLDVENFKEHDGSCPIALLKDFTLNVGMDAITIESQASWSRFNKFLCGEEIW